MGKIFRTFLELYFIVRNASIMEIIRN